RRLLKNSGVRWATCFGTLKLRLEIVQDLRCPLQRARATTCYSAQGFDLVSKRLLTCVTIRPPRLKMIAKPRITTASTATTRGSLNDCRRLTKGASTKLRST